MVEAGEAAVISGHAAGGMRSGAAQPAHQGGESLSEAEGSDAEARTGTGESCCQEEDESDSEAEPLEATEGGRRAGTRQQRGHEYVEEDEDSDEGGEEEGGDGDADVDQQVGAGASHEVSFDAKSRTKLERVIVVPRVIQKRNDLAMAVIKSNWEGAAELGSIVYPLYKTVGSETVVVRAETPPREALAIQEKVMARLAGLQLFCVGLPEANGNEIRWRLATKDGLVLDFCYQLKQGSVLHWFSKGQGRGPQTVRGAAIDPVIPDEAPAGYPGGKGKFANECTRLAYVYVLSNAREGFEDKVLTLFDCSSFINQSEWTIRHVLNNPHDFSFGWFSR